MSDKPTSDKPIDPELHAEVMRGKQKLMRERIAQADQVRGVLLVLTGPGKGKSSSAFGMVARALGHGMKVGVVQFIKGRFKTGEERFFASQPGIVWHVMGEGYTWDTQDRSRDIATSRRGWDQACELLRDDSFDLIVLDELNIVLNLGYLPLDEVIEELRRRPPTTHVVITGRDAPPGLIAAADTVTEMGLVKHAFEERGIRAQKGVEL